MDDQMPDKTVLQHIEELVSQEHGLHEKEAISEEERVRLRQIQIELDQFWDLLRQRRALRTVGQDPDRAYVRPPEIVEKYEQ